MYKNKFQKNKGRDASKNALGQVEILRVPLPKGNQVLGVLEQRFGASHMLIKCLDGKARNCRVPGRLKRRLWLREGDIVLIQPWELGGDERGDILLKYNPAQVQWLKKRGLLKIESEF